MLLFHNTVKQLKIFQWIEPNVVESIVDTAQREEFTAGTIILEQGDVSNGTWYIIEKWTVTVWVNGKQTAELKEWEMFWEFALLNEEPRSATIIAKTDCTCIILSEETLFQMIQNDNNSINKEVMRRMEENLENEE